MFVDFDEFPTLYPLVKNSVYMSDLWASFMSVFYQNLTQYLSANGIFIPQLTLAQQAAIQTPVEGQMIYITDAVTVPKRTARLVVWQVVLDVGQWTVIV